LGMAVTFVLVTFIWAFFRSENIEKAITVLKQCFVYQFEASKNVQLSIQAICMLLLFVFWEVLIKNSRFDKYLKKQSVFVRWFAYIGLLCCILLFSGIQSFQFIYFQF
jgi:hypothetical protein